MEKKRRYWWMYVLIFLAGQLIAGVIALLLPMLSHISYENTMITTLAIANLLGIGLFLLYRPANVTVEQTMSGLKGRMGQRSLLVFLFAIPMIILTNLVQELFFPDIPDFVGEDSLSMIMQNPVGLITLGFLGPINEELLFRGGVQNPMSGISEGVLSIVFSALIFSIAHLNPAQMPIAFILGLVLGYAYWWTGSLIAPLCIHVFNNCFACMLSILSPGDQLMTESLGGPRQAYIAIVVCICLILVMSRVMRKA